MDSSGESGDMFALQLVVSQLSKLVGTQMIEDDDWKMPESIWDMRRKAPFHFLAKANNARMSAYVLSHIDDNLANELASAARYGDDHSFALHEAFRREASISMELILKAILCVKTKSAPPAKHDVYEFWSKADLPKLSEDDSFRLAEMTEILYWSGRYAAPNSDKAMNKPNERFEKHRKNKHIGKVKIIENPWLGWKEFDALYKIAARHFWDLKPNDPSNFVA